MKLDRTDQGGVRARRAVALAIVVMAFGLAFGGAGSDRADAANLYDVTCSSVNDTIYFTLPANDNHQWLWYRLWRLDPATGRWYAYFDAPNYYVQPSWNSQGFVGGGPGGLGGSTRNGALTWVTVHQTGWYYVAALVVYTTDTAAVGSSYEWVGDYSNITSRLVDRRWCLIE